TTANDHLQINYAAPQYDCLVPPAANGGDLYPLTASIPNAPKNVSGTATMRIPNYPSDVPQHYVIEYWVNTPGNPNNCAGGPNQVIAQSAVTTVSATIARPTYPAAPSYITYPPPGWTQTTETVTVCPQGPPTCQFNNLDDASWYINNQDTNKDWIKVDVV